MNPFKNMRFFGFDASVPRFVNVYKNQVVSKKVDGRMRYFVPDNPDLLVVRALNIKKASAKFLTIISKKAVSA